jgi:cytochrome P450
MWLRLLLPVALLWLISKLYTAFFGPLNRYPGPLLNKLTSLPYVRVVSTGKEATTIRQWHDKYGPVVRVAPNRLSYVGFPETWADICGVGAKSNQPGLPKDPAWYEETLNGTPNLVMCTDEDHRRQRRIFGRAFSEKALRDQEPLLRRWAGALYYKLLEKSAGGASLDMLKMFNCTTFDIMADLCFAEPLYMLENTTYAPWVEAVFSMLKQLTLIRAVRYIHPVCLWLVRVACRNVPAIQNEYVRHWKYTAERVDRRLASTPDRPDLLTEVLNMTSEDKDDRSEELKLQELYVNAQTFMLAGTETTATVLSAVTFYLLSNPDMMTHLRTEIRSTFATIDDLHLDPLANKCPYMNACLKEALRFHPPIPIGLPRLTPAEGATINGQFVPGGTSVFVHQTATYRSALLWKDPDSFRPERWLDGSKEYENDKRDSMEPFSFGPRNCIGKVSPQTESGNGIQMS